MPKWDSECSKVLNRLSRLVGIPPTVYTAQWRTVKGEDTIQTVQILDVNDQTS